MPYVIENLRLKDLSIIARNNQPFYDEFAAFLRRHGYPSVRAFINEPSDEKAVAVLLEYFGAPFKAELLDGLGRPLNAATAKWYFVTWLLRDAPAQRLGPLVGEMPGRTLNERRALLVNQLRTFTAPLFPEPESWDWPVIREVVMARLEGSRRALKGGLFDNIVRVALRDSFSAAELSLTISAGEVRLFDETYDVEVIGAGGKILMPVKTRETMGGGHAILFTRDIHKSITVAEENGYKCIPVVIAESWGGNLSALPCEQFIYIAMNPNQIKAVGEQLAIKIRDLLPVFRALEQGSR